MTLCVGIERRGRVWIGADCASVREDGWSERAREAKVWRAGAWLVASAGDWRALEAAKGLRFSSPAEFAHELRALCERLSIPLEDAEREGTTRWLLGARGKGLWELDSCLHPARTSECSIGVASDYARGWLDGSAIADPQLRIRECIRAASRRMPSAVRLPALVFEAT